MTETETRYKIQDLQTTMGVESKDNPFTSDGELAKKAEYIMRHSTISRTEIRISDPDLRSEKEEEVKEETIQAAATTQNSAARPGNLGKENGKPEPATVSPKSVEVEVSTANASQPQPQQAEQVKLKQPKCKCCTIM